MVLRVGATPDRAGTAPVTVAMAGPASMPLPAWAPPQVPLTADLPTFPAQADRPAWKPGRPGPAEPSPDAAATLAQLAAHLEQTGRPEVPEGVPVVRQAGNLAAAAGEMAGPPADLASYLRQNAPSLKAAPDLTWTTEGYYPPWARDGRIDLHRPRSDGPWFWFSFAADGRIQAAGEQAGAPR